MSLYTYSNVSWNLPLLFCHDNLIFIISEIMKEFKDEVPPKLYAYGSTKLAWSGGRYTDIRFFDKIYIENHLRRVIDSGFIPTFTFTKPYLKKDSLNDKTANWLLDCAVEHNCEFLICSENLNKYIKDKYPNAKTHASILQAKMEFHNPKRIPLHTREYKVNFYNKLLKEYDRVVPVPEFIIEDLDAVKYEIEDISKLEVLINETCIPHCPQAIFCYTHHDKTSNKKGYCLRTLQLKNQGFESIKENLLLQKDFIDYLVNNVGIRHLKLQGRHYPVHFLYNLVLSSIYDITGSFQTIYRKVLDKAAEYEFEQRNMPIEQIYMLEQYFKLKKYWRIR
jgi:hypothetical protein